MYIAGVVAFVFFFLNDFNDWKIGKSLLKFCFPLGGILLVVATAGLSFPFNEGAVTSVQARIIIGVFCLFVLWAEIYSLFFSFDRSEAYTSETVTMDRVVYTSRMYALCRHPGVLFFVVLYIGLWLCIGLPLQAAVLFSVLNVLLAVFEDIAVFPAILGGYAEYKKNTPFIIPGVSGIRRCIQDFRR